MPRKEEVKHFIPHLQEYAVTMMPELIENFIHGHDHRKVVENLFYQAERPVLLQTFQIAKEAWIEQGGGPEVLDEAFTPKFDETHPWGTISRRHLADLWNELPRHGSKLPWLVYYLRLKVLNEGIDNLSSWAAFFVVLESFKSIGSRLKESELIERAARVTGVNPTRAAQVMKGTKDKGSEINNARIEAKLFFCQIMHSKNQ